jgi:hypothetical protein
MILGIFVWTLRDLIGLAIIAIILLIIAIAFIRAAILDTWKWLKKKFKSKKK